MLVSRARSSAERASAYGAEGRGFKSLRALQLQITTAIHQFIPEQSFGSGITLPTSVIAGNASRNIGDIQRVAESLSAPGPGTTGFRKLLIRFEKRMENYRGLVHFACALIVYRLIVLG